MLKLVDFKMFHVSCMSTYNATHYAHEVHAVKNWKPVFNYPPSPSVKNFNIMGQAQGQISDNCKTSMFCIEILLAIWGHLKPYRLQSPSEDSRLLCIIFALFASNRRNPFELPPVAARFVGYASCMPRWTASCLAHKLSTPLSASVHHANSGPGPWGGQDRLTWESRETWLHIYTSFILYMRHSSTITADPTNQSSK